MRVIGKILGAEKADLFLAFLSREGIEAKAEKCFSSTGEEEHFEIWVLQEDQMDIAKSHLAHFVDCPTATSFQKPTPPKQQTDLSSGAFSSIPDKNPPKVNRMRPSFPIIWTKLIIVLCALLFIWMTFQNSQLERAKDGTPLGIAPLFLDLAYDVPEKELQLQKFLQKYDIQSTEDLQKLPEQALHAYREIAQLPSFPGFYTIALKWPESKKDLSAPMFRKISSGQIWRVITPIFLHGNWLHILFNMLWLWVLGKQLEERLKVWQYLAITLLIAAISNTVQYVMGGPLFVGYSGVLCGLVGFIWVRQRIAPWEGYPLQPLTIIFLALFVAGMLAFQLVSFILARFSIASLSVGVIANSAHVSGAICGMILGRISFFSKGAI